MRIRAVVPAENGDDTGKLAVRIEDRRAGARRSLIQPDIVLGAENLQRLLVIGHRSARLITGISFMPAGADKSPGRADKLVLFGIAQHFQDIDVFIQETDHETRTFQKPVQIRHERTADVDEFPVSLQQVLQFIAGQDLVVRPRQRIDAQSGAAPPGVQNLLGNDGRIDFGIARNESPPLQKGLLIKPFIILRAHEIHLFEQLTFG